MSDVPSFPEGVARKAGRVACPSRPDREGWPTEPGTQQPADAERGCDTVVGVRSRVEHKPERGARLADEQLRIDRDAED